MTPPQYTHPHKESYFPPLHDVLALSFTAYALTIGLVNNLATIRNSDGGPAYRVILDAGCAINRVPSFTTAWGESTTLTTPSLVIEVLTADQGSISQSKSEPYSVSPMRPTSRPAVLEVVEM